MPSKNNNAYAFGPSNTNAAISNTSHSTNPFISSASSSDRQPRPTPSRSLTGQGGGHSPLLASYDDRHHEDMSQNRLLGPNMSRQGSADSMGSRYNPNSPHLSPSAQPLYRSGSPTPSSSDLHAPAGPYASINSRGGYRGGAGAVGATAFGEKGWSANNASGNTLAPSISDKFSLSPDPASWGANVALNHPEPDDYLHNPDPKRDRRSDRGGSIFTLRGLENIGCIAVLVLALMTLFAGYPLIVYFGGDEPDTLGGYNLGGINGTGQVAARLGNFNLIDIDTPPEAYTYTSRWTGETWDLVFSDEFNQDGRTFWPGDDPFWEAENIHYWGTNNLEWYDPRSITTEGGNLKITLTNSPQRGLDYTGGLMSTWNKFCFRGGYVETSLVLPGTSSVYGLWPAVWTMGNLGRMGYGGTLDGMWPYSYDSCDTGTMPNQTLNGGPDVALTTGSQNSPFNGSLSYLTGQRLSSCTCPDDPTHPGPVKPNGDFRGRAAPEIDLIEAQVLQTDHGIVAEVSQSCQWAPFNPYYYFSTNVSGTDYLIMDDEMTKINTYLGGVYQQATSGVSYTDPNCYEGNTGCFSIYGFEYALGDEGYVWWVNDNKPAWWIASSAMKPVPEADVGQRPIPYEPMYLIVNLGLSENFGAIDYDGLEQLWPVHMLIDYIRVYQDPKVKDLGCDPEDMPTASYIEMYKAAYTNPNISTFDQIPEPHPPKPKNRLDGGC